MPRRTWRFAPPSTARLGGVALAGLVVLGAAEPSWPFGMRQAPRARTSRANRRIFDALVAMGPISATGLAVCLGAARSGVLHHLQRLEELGLVRRTRLSGMIMFDVVPPVTKAELVPVGAGAS